MRALTKTDLTRATLLDMLTPEEAKEVASYISRRRKGGSASYTYRPGMVLEQAYTNPKVRRWHAKDQADREHFEKLLEAAGEADAQTLADAYSGDWLGFAPEYDWKFSDSGIFTPRDVQIFRHGTALSVAQDTLLVKDPEEVVAKVLGVENPEQIALRLTGAAAPALQPRTSSIIIAPHPEPSLHERGFLLSTAVGLPNSGAISFYFDVVDGQVRGGHLEGMYLYDKKGNGYGLAAFSSIHSWLDKVSDSDALMSLTAEQVGTYVWPRLGFDGDGDDLDDALMQLAEVETGDSKRGPGFLEYVEGLSYELGSLPEVARREHNGEKTGREALLNIHRFDELYKHVVDTEYVYDVAEKRVEALGGEE